MDGMQKSRHFWNNLEMQMEEFLTSGEYQKPAKVTVQHKGLPSDWKEVQNWRRKNRCQVCKKMYGSVKKSNKGEFVGTECDCTESCAG
jgi:hypothetical protein